MLVMATGLLPGFCKVTWRVPRCRSGRLPKSMLAGMMFKPPLPVDPDTVIVNTCVALDPTPLPATKFRVDVPAEVGVPLSVPVPFWLSVNEIPAGNVPSSERVGTGKPDAVTMKDAGTPTLKLAVFALVIDGA